MTRKPLVSIIMGIYNCEETLSESIDSIVNQTYLNWELILCDDNSSDKTYEIASSYANQYSDKIILIKNDQNLGLAGSLNHCLRYAKGKYIARQDGDDKSFPLRLETQVNYLESYPKYDLVGTSMKAFDNKCEKKIITINREPNIEKIAVRPPFYHATIMAKKHVFENLEGYRVTKYTKRCEDIDLWFRFFEKGYKGVNLIDPLYYVRVDQNSYKRRNIKSYFYATKVCIDGYRLLKLPFKSYIYILKPIIGAFTPTFIKKIYHK